MKCKSCKEEFDPIKRNGIVISKLCISCLSMKGKAKIKKQANIDKREAKEKLKTHKDYLNDLQKLFNTFIRLRDKNKPCISCGSALDNKYDAGHYYSVGGNPELRFNENNVHAQCVYCNRHLHGNLIDYTEQLPARIGIENFESLKSIRGVSNKLTVYEIKEIIKKYKSKISKLKT